MSSVYFPTEAAHLHSYACPVVEVLDTIPRNGSIQSRSCKRRYEGLQERSPLASAVAAPSSFPFDGVPHGNRCTVNRSASMDSDASSFSPVPKRHRFCPLEAPSDADSAQFDCHYAQHQESFPQEHASTAAPILADAQKAYALKLMLSQSSPQEAAALIAFLQHFQHRRPSSQHGQAQPLCQSTVSQPAAHYRNNRLPPSTILKLQAAYGQVVQACQHQQQHACDTHPQHVVAESRQTSLDVFMTHLRDIQTPAQHGKESFSMASHSRPAAAAWYDNPAVPVEPKTIAYEPVQPQIEAYWSAYQQEQEPSQPDFMWQSAAAVAHCSQAAATACEVQASQAPPAVGSRLLYTQQQAMLHQLAEQKRLRMQQHMAREQQAFLERRAALSPLRPALSFPELAAYWAKGLSLQRCESVYLACHLWTKVQEQVSIAYMHLLGAEKPWETMLVGCLWLAAKLEECRRGVPTASKAGALVGVDKSIMGGVELYLMQLVNWAPLAGWKDRPLQSEDDSWY